MANMRPYKPSFSGGEISPEMFGRIDDGKFQSGAASIENLIATALGPAEKRPGLEYIRPTKNNGVARLIPFTYSTTQTVAIEIGAGYFRFHTQGATLSYSIAGLPAWVAPSGAISLSYTTPAIVSWTAHGLTTGDPIRFYLTGAHSATELPAGFQVGYTYTVVVIDADNFNILDNGVPVALPATGGGAFTNYPGTFATTANIGFGPNQSEAITSGTLTGLASVAVTGGLATVNVDLDSEIFGLGGIGAVDYQYSTGGAWQSFNRSTSSEAFSMSFQIAIANIDLLQLRIVVDGHTTSGGSLYATGTIYSWSVDVPTSGGPGGLDFVKAYRYYTASELVSYAGDYYAAVATDSGGTTAPGTDPTIWQLLRRDLIYEVANSYTVGDLFGIHYVQSADVLTLVHPNYPPMELRRLSATAWSFLPIVFGQVLNPPTAAAIVASPGYLARVASISTANPALFTTVSNHTLSLGDGIYVKGLTATIAGVVTVLDDFYLVNSVPVDGMGNLIPNQLTLMDYSGNILDSSGWSAVSSGATIQFGSKIFNITQFYVVTAVASDGIQQSGISAEVSVLNNLNVTGSFNTISWAAVAGAFRYYVYKRLNGLYGYIGQTTAATLTFDDNNIACDMGITPPQFDPVFASAGNYPGAVSYFQQRRCFGGTTDQPQNFWMTKSGTESDMSYSLPIQDTDRVAIGIAVRELATIEHIVPLLQLVLLTNSAEISVSPINTDVITPSTIDPRPQSYIGASNVPPTIVNNSLIYASARGGHVREMGFQWQIGGFITGDISLRAAHLFDNLTIVDQTFMKCPWQAVWFVSSNGNLLGLTYIPEQQIGAWHHHVTDGKFESIACVAEGAEDRLYAIVNRTIGGVTVRYIERMSTRNYGGATQDCFFVDAGGTFDGTNATVTTAAAVLDTTPGPLFGTYNLTASAATFAYPTQSDAGSYLILTGSDGNKYQFNILSTSSTTAANALPVTAIPAGVTFAAGANWAWARTTIGGLTWLEGKTVAILADGAVQPRQVVTGGSVSIQHPCTLVTIGLPYKPAIETLPLVLQIDGSGQGRVKNINKCWVRVYQSSSISAGPTLDALVEYKQRTNEPYGQAPALVTKELEITIPASWSTDGKVYITQDDPLPLTVVGLTLEAAIGG